MPLRWIRLLFWLYLLILVLAEASASNPADPDLWHRLAVGEFVWQKHTLPPGGTFSYLADYRDIADHEWGSALVFYAAYARAGGAAIVAIKIVSLALTVSLVASAGLRGRPPTLLLAAFYALVLLALLPSFQSTVRCMVFTHLFFALWLYWYQLERDGRAIPLWGYLAIIVPWANLHGGFAIGLLWLLGVTVVQFCYRLDWKKWALRFVFCTAATLFNPFGWRLWISTGRALVTTRRDFGEWAPVSWWPDLTGYPGYKLLLCLTVATFASLLLRRAGRAQDRPAIIFIAGALLLSLLSARHASLFAAVAGVFLPGLFPARPASEESAIPLHRLGRFGLRVALVILPLFAALDAFPGDGLQLRYPAVSCPVGAVDFLQRAQVRGNLLVPFNYGSYALWRLRGRMRVSMDGRYDLVYRPETYRRVEDFFLARGNWAALLVAPPPSAILLPLVDPVYPQLKARTGWTQAYHDTTDAVFLPALTSPLTKK